MPAELTNAEAAILRRQALAIIREGRLTNLRASWNGDWQYVPTAVTAQVLSSRPGGRAYAVVYTAGGPGWWCTCNHTGCAHIAAAQLVTGRPS